MKKSKKVLANGDTITIKVINSSKSIREKTLSMIKKLNEETQSLTQVKIIFKLNDDVTIDSETRDIITKSFLNSEVYYNFGYAYDINIPGNMQFLKERVEMYYRVNVVSTVLLNASAYNKKEIYRINPSFELTHEAMVKGLKLTKGSVQELQKLLYYGVKDQTSIEGITVKYEVKNSERGLLVTKLVTDITRKDVA